MRISPARPSALVVAAVAIAFGAAACTPAGEPTTEAAPSASTLSDDEAAQVFFDAVVAGDREAAATVAAPAALDFFEPWEPVEGMSFSGVQDGVFFISPGAAPFQCTVAGGLVQGCLDEPAGD